MADSVTVEMFPVLNSKIIKESRTKIEFEAFSLSGKELSIEGTNKLTFDTELEDWAMDADGLRLKLSISISNPAAFYGSGSVAGHETSLGVAAVIKSPSSCRRRTYNSDIDINCHTTKIDEGMILLELSPDEFRGSATLEIVLYVKSGNSNDKYAYEPGYVLGILHSTVLSLDGNSSIFPIDIIQSEGDFLWRLECDYSDLTTDRFDESVALVFNEKHPMFKEFDIDRDKNNRLSPAFLSVLSHSIQILIEKVMKEPGADQVMSGENLSEGSVGAAVHYLITSFEALPDSPVDLAYEIERYLFPFEVGPNGKKMEDNNGQ